MQMSVKLASTNLNPSEEYEQSLINQNADGAGLLDWQNVEELFKGVVSFESGGRPPLRRQGELLGYTWQYFTPGKHSVSVERRDTGRIPGHEESFASPC